MINKMLVKSSLTEADKLFLINIVETYLPKETVFDAREEVMVALESVEKSWMDQLLTANSLEAIRFVV